VSTEAALAARRRGTERALNAEDALKAAHHEITVQRITTENTTLKQRVRTLTAGNRTLEEKLKAAREQGFLILLGPPGRRPDGAAGLARHATLIGAGSRPASSTDRA
jgi:hypothetical protein